VKELAPSGIELGNGAPPGIDDQTIARFTHFANLPPHARVGLAEDLALILDAHFIGCTPERLQGIRQQHAESVARAASELLEQRDFQELVADLPFKRGDRIVVVGDSITADSLSWAHILDAVLKQTRHDEVRLVNLAVSGSTTGELIAMFDLVTRAHPTWVLQMIGTNDVRQHGSRAGIRAVSLEETGRNLQALERLTRRQTAARFVPITPPPTNQAMFDAFMPMDADTRWLPGDLDAVVELTRTCLPFLIDLGSRLPRPATSSFWIEDGLHPSLEGHQTILRCIVQSIVESRDSF
jgi:lysophospholipase L1-like esterase